MSVKCCRYLGVVALAVVALFILGGMVYGLHEHTGTFSVIDVKLNSVYVLRDADGVGMNVSFRLSNPSSNDLVLRNVKYYVSVDGARVGEVSSEGELMLSPYTSKEVTIVVRVTNNDTLTHIIKSLQRGIMNLSIQVEGRTPVKWYGITEFSTKETSAQTTNTVNASQILAAEESKAGPANTTQPLVSDEEPVIQVLSVKWYANGHEVTEVKSGTKVTLQVKVKALKDLEHTQLNAYIINDYKVLPDITYKYMQTYIHLKKGQHGLYSFTFTAKHHWLLRGYYAQITITERIIEGNGPPISVEGVYYKMPNHYPPRLKVKK